MPKVFYHSSIYCNSCIQTIGGALQDKKYITAVTGNVATAQIAIDYNEFNLQNEKAALDAIERIGHKAQRLGFAPTSYSYLLSRGIIATLVGVTFFVLAICNINIPMWAIYSLLAINFIITLYSGQQIYSSAFYKSKAKQFSMDLLFSVSATVAFGLCLASLFMPGTGMALDMMWSTAPLMFGFRNLGKYVQKKAKQGVLGNVDLLQRLALKVTRIENYAQPNREDIQDVDIYNLKVGDIIQLNKGQVIPTDGRCLSHAAQINQVNISGEDGAQIFNIDQEITAGMQAESSFYMQVTKPVLDSSLAQKQRRMQEALFQKAPVEKKADRILKYFVPAIFLISIGCGLSVGFLYQDIFMALHVSLAIIAGACPCSLALIVPLAVLMAWFKAKQHGLECYSAAALDVADEITLVSLDLYGTLTEGKPMVEKIVVDSSVNEEEVLRIAYAMQLLSEHAIAKTIRSEIKKRNPHMDEKLLPKMTTSSLCTGAKGIGITALFESAGEHILGNRKFLQGYPEILIPADSKTQQLSQMIYLASTNTQQIIATFELFDKIRPDAKALIQSLKGMRKEVAICTGSEESVAQAYAAELDVPLSNVKSSCHGNTKENIFPKEKEIQEWQRAHFVAHVGDNWNDEGAFSKSDLGIIVPSGSTKAVEKKDSKNEDARAEKKLAGGLVAVTEADSLMPVLNLFALSKQMKSFITQVLCFSLVFNACQVIAPEVLLLTTGYQINPGIDTALMIVQMALIMLYAYRFKQQALPEFKQVPEQVAQRAFECRL